MDKYLYYYILILKNVENNPHEVFIIGGKMKGVVTDQFAKAIDAAKADDQRYLFEFLSEIVGRRFNFASGCDGRADNWSGVLCGFITGVELEFNNRSWLKILVSTPTLRDKQLKSINYVSGDEIEFAQWFALIEDQEERKITGTFIIL